MSRPTADHLDTKRDRMDEIPNPPAHMWAKYRHLFETLAPDLLDMVWDADAAKVAEVAR